MDEKKVRDELRALRNAGRRADSLLDARFRHEKRLSYLEAHHIDREAEACRAFLRSLDPAPAIAAANALEEKYFPYIMALNTVDQTIMTDGFINGKPYWKIGQTVGYSSDGVQKRVKRIIKEIAAGIP